MARQDELESGESTRAGPGAPPVASGGSASLPARLVGGVRHFRELGILIALLAVLTVFAVLNPVFLSPQNIADVTRNASFTFVAAVGAAYVFAAGGLDLSVGSLFGVGAVAGGLVIVDLGAPILVAVIVAIAASSLLGLVNGLVIVRARIPALVATLGMLYAARGLIMIVTEGQPIFPFPREITDLVIARIAGLPIMVILAIVLALVAHYGLNHMRFGREILAVGGNREAARLVGIPVDRISIAVYMLSGAAAGLAGILAASRLGTAQASAGSGFELTVIAAVIIGGTSMFGGSATIIGTVIGSLLLAVLSNGMTIIGLSPFYQNLLVGVVIVFAVALDQWRRTRPV
jgi:ribose/xylose/arabinose/galactoside ABC-type transport system permease subunit